MRISPRRRHPGRPDWQDRDPALIDAHNHIGLTNVRERTNSKDNYTRENLIDHLERSAYHGVAVSMSLGLEYDEELAFRLREEEIPNAALL